MRACVLALLGLAILGCSLADPWGEAAALPPRPFVVEPAPPAPAEPATLEGRTLTLAECVTLALERNPRSRGSWHAARAAAARVGEERSAWLPSAAFTAGVTRSDTPGLRDDGLSPETEIAGGFGLRYLVFDGGLRSARVQAARQELLAANYRHHAVVLDVALEVALAYAERLAADSLVRVAEETVVRSQAHIDLARARREAGTALRYDVLKAETEKADAELGHVRARGAARVARGRLCQAMGLRVSVSFSVEELSEDAARRDLADVVRLLDEAARSRPELLALGAQVEARRADLRAAESEYLPTVAAAADYGWRELSDGARREEWIAGIGLSLPLFDGFATRYRTGLARAEIARASAEGEAALRGIEFDVWTAHSRVLEAAEAVEAARAFAASADESARVADGMYRNGAGSIIELADSLAARTEARTRSVQAVLDLHSARARFERSVGRALP